MPQPALPISSLFGLALAATGISTFSRRSTVPLTRKVRTANLGGSYDIGPVKLFGELPSVRNGFETAFASTHDSYDGYLLGATVPVGSGPLRASYSTVRRGRGGLTQNAAMRRSLVRCLA